MESSAKDAWYAAMRALIDMVAAGDACSSWAARVGEGSDCHERRAASTVSARASAKRCSGETWRRGMRWVQGGGLTCARGWESRPQKCSRSNVVCAFCLSCESCVQEAGQSWARQLPGAGLAFLPSPVAATALTTYSSERERVVATATVFFLPSRCPTLPYLVQVAASRRGSDRRTANRPDDAARHSQTQTKKAERVVGRRENPKKPRKSHKNPASLP